MLRPALLAAALATALPAHADADVDALRAELNEMKAAYEARIQALETRLQEVEAHSAAAAADHAPPAPSAAAEPARSNSFNPDISLILQGRYAHLEDRPDRSITGFLPSGAEGPSRGFSVDDSELVFSASVDPYFRGYLNATLADGSVGVEEAWFQTTSLGQGLSIKGGRFRSGIGYQNEQHPHAWDFATNNLVYEALFGEGYAQDGLQLKWLAPTDTFLEFGAEAGRGGAFPSTDRDSNGFSSAALFGHVGGDVGVSNSWRAGLSWLHARPQNRGFAGVDFEGVPVVGAFSGTSRTWLADFVWKWAPEGNSTQRNFKFAAEYFQRQESGALACGDADPAAPSACVGGLAGDYASDQSGLYLQGVYQFLPRWRAGYRYDRLFRGDVSLAGADAGAILGTLADHDAQRHSLMLDYNPSEFTRIRLQYTLDQAQRDVDENQFYVQYIYSLGSHGAHKF